MARFVSSIKNLFGSPSKSSSSSHNSESPKSDKSMEASIVPDAVRDGTPSDTASPTAQTPTPSPIEEDLLPPEAITTPSSTPTEVAASVFTPPSAQNPAPESVQDAPASVLEDAPASGSASPTAPTKEPGLESSLPAHSSPPSSTPTALIPVPFQDEALASVLPGEKNNEIDVDNPPDFEVIRSVHGPLGNPNVRRSKRLRGYSPADFEDSDSTPEISPKKQKTTVEGPSKTGGDELPIPYVPFSDSDDNVNQFVVQPREQVQPESKDSDDDVPLAQMVQRVRKGKGVAKDETVSRLTSIAAESSSETRKK